MIQIGDTITTEKCRGDIIGALDVYMQRPRTASCVAVRESEVTRIQKISYTALATIYHPFAMSFWDTFLWAAPMATEDPLVMSRKARSSNLRTIAIVPLSVDTPVAYFVSMISEALIRCRIFVSKDILAIDSSSVLESMHTNVYSTSGNLHLENYVQQLQENVELLLFIADHNTDSMWNDVCISNVRDMTFLYVEKRHDINILSYARLTAFYFLPPLTPSVRSSP